MGIRYTLHDSKLITKHMIFTTCVAFAPWVADMLKYLYLHTLQGSAKENMLLTVRPALADICVSKVHLNIKDNGCYLLLISEHREILQQILYTFSILSNQRYV